MAVTLLELGFLGLLLLGVVAVSPSSARDTVSPGNPLASSDRLVSNNSKFALGFFKMDNRSRHMYLGTWFHKVPTLTPVWSANGESPVVDPASPELAIDGDGNLAILDGSTKRAIWSTNASTSVLTTNRTEAVLLGNGNLVVRSAANASLVFWQSFDHPTDTLLAGAKLGWDRATGLNRRLVSRKSLVDQAPGLYSLELGRDRVGHLLWNGTVEFWTSGEWNGRYFNLAPEMIGAMTPNFSFVNTPDESTFSYTLRGDYAAADVRSAVDAFGQGLVGAWLEPLHNWLVNYRQPILQCDVFATCGPFTVCRESADPICACMKGFALGSPEDWDVGDRSHGCSRRNTPLSCEHLQRNKTGLSVAEDKFYAVQGVARMPQFGEKVADAASREDCERLCLRNCSCTAYSFSSGGGNGGGCSVWLGDLYNLKQADDASSSAAATSSNTLYIRLAASEVPETASSGGRNNRSRINAAAAAGGAGAAAALALALLLLGLALLRRRRKKGKWLWSSDAQDGVGIIAFRYADLQRATRNFADRLGGGSFGSVFKGHLGGDGTLLAVKRLDGARQGEKQFRAEVNSVGVIQHINLVKLIGFCCEGDRRLLVYEFMPNHSLDVHLFAKPNTTKIAVLDWSRRYQIAVGVSRGLAYLHSGCRDRIIHCDIKPENILLDAAWAAKIADFGMAKVLGREHSQAVTTMRGTIGYLAPEWIAGAPVTPKVDVYSYGMVLFELVSGRRNASSLEEYAGKDCADYSAFFPLQVARALLHGGGGIAGLVDPSLQGDVNLNLKEVERVCRVACWCIQDNELDRPTMAEVVQFLEGVVEVDMPPVPRLLNAITAAVGPPTSEEYCFTSN